MSDPSTLNLQVKKISGLWRYDLMLSAIAECHHVDEAKDIRDRAIALRVYAIQAGDVEAERRLAQIRLRAERRAGQILKEMAESGERDAGGRGTVEFREGTQLADLGVSKKQSHLWQQLAEIPEEAFETFMADGPSAYKMLRRAEIKKNEEEHPWWEEHWRGMPEFIMEDLTPRRTIKVHFQNEDDVATFADLIGQNITARTKYVWFPKAEIAHYRGRRRVTDPPPPDDAIVLGDDEEPPPEPDNATA
jgi:hypothetical protein